MNYRTALAVLGAAIILPTLGVSASLGSNISTPVISNQAAATPLNFQVNYFRGLEVGATLGVGGITAGSVTSPEEYVDIVNPGSDGADVRSSTNGIGDLCALIYVFDTNEELEECCGCLVTPDQLIEEPVQANLLSNPATTRILHNGAIKILSSAPTSTPKAEYDNTVCNPAAPNPTPELLAWITHTRTYGAVAVGAAGLAGAATPATLGVTEVAFEFAPLSAGEQAVLTSDCGFLQSNGTGAGICACPTPLP